MTESRSDYFARSAAGQGAMWPALLLGVLALAVVSPGSPLVSNYNDVFSITAMLTMFLVANLAAWLAHVLYEQGFLSRAAWLATAAGFAWFWFAARAPFAEAARYSLLHANGDLKWLVVSQAGYWLFGIAAAASVASSLYFVVHNTLADFGIVEPLEFSAVDVRRRAANQAQGNSALETRDADARAPRLTFSDLAGNDELKARLAAAAHDWENGGKKDGKNGVFLYGPPGTGKTAFAEALAGEMKLKIMSANISSVIHRYIGQTTQQVNDLIDRSLAQAPCVLFLDEAETLLVDRSTLHDGSSEEAKVVDAFLTGVAKLRAGRVFLIAATNYKDKCDPAAIREGRFDFHIEVAFPDYGARKGLIEHELQRAGKTVDAAVLDRLAKRWAGFNVKRIMEASERGCGFASTKEVAMADFMRGLRDVQGNKTGAGEGARSIADLYFDAPVKERLVRLAAEFARSDEIESFGGHVPRGVIFYGPPGTGKTSMARALAKDSGMAFVPTTGKELLSDVGELKKVCAKASDLRPSIVFIDEADDILADRNTSGMKLHTNELLAAIDGANGPLPDVVWVLATNNIASFDEAATRRFPVKIELPIPGTAVVAAMVGHWADGVENLADDKTAWVDGAVQALDGLSPSMIESVLESARNHAAVDRVTLGRASPITLGMVLEARREMRT